MQKRFHDLTVKVFLIVLSTCCMYGMFIGARLLWIQTAPTPNGRHTRNLVTAADYVQVAMVVRRAEIGGAITAMHSVVNNTNTPVHFNLVTDNNTMDYLWTWIEHSSLKETSYEIKGVTQQWLEGELGITGESSDLLPYSAIVLQALFPNVKGNVIVLDSDVIVVGDIAELKHIKLGKKLVAALSSNCDTTSRLYNLPQKLYASFVDVTKDSFRDLHLNASACTFASGVSVFDIDEWKRQNISSHILHWIHLNQKERIFEGSGPLPAMMIALFGKVTTLNPLWNVRNLGISPISRYAYHAYFVSSAKLLHWNGPFKPWKRQSPYQKIWDKYWLPDPTGQFKPMRNASS